MKWIAALICTVVLLLTSSHITFAETAAVTVDAAAKTTTPAAKATDGESKAEDPGAASTDEADKGALINKKTQEKLDAAEDDASLMDGFIIGQANNLFKIPGINSLSNLVFGNPYATWGFSESSEDLVDGIFFQSEIDNIITPLLTTFSGIYGSILMLAMMIGSLKFSMKAITPSGKSDFWQDIQMYVFSAFFLALFWPIFNALMSINWGIVEAVHSSFSGSIDGISIIASATNDEAYKFSVGDIFVFVAEWGLAFYLNFIYVSRKLIILFLVVLSPFAAYSLLFAKTRSFFGTYMKELVANIFMQSIHAIVLFIFVGMAANVGQGMGGTVFKLAMIIMFVPMTGMASKLLNFGDNSSRMGQMATSVGLGGITGAYMLTRNAAQMAGGLRSGKMGGSSGGGSSIETPGGESVSMGNDGAKSALSRAAGGGSGWNRVQKAMSVAGGAIGASFGAPLGPGGVMAGATMGSKILPAISQTARDFTAGVSGATNVIRNAGRGVDENGNMSKFSMSNLKSNWKDLAERRQMMGNLGESVGKTMGGIGAAVGGSFAGPLGSLAGGAIASKMGVGGKAMGQMLSGVSRQRAFSSGSGANSPKGMTLSGLANDSRYRGSNVRFNQTNDRSWFEMQEGDKGNWSRIGGYGAGDSNLNNGQRRAIDYKLNDGAPWKRQENGTYTNDALAFGSASASGAISRSSNEVVGLSGSTGSLARKSGAYMLDSSGQKSHADSNFDMRKLNVDDYFNHNAPGMRTNSDKLADGIGNTSAKIAQGVSNIRPNTAKKEAWVQTAAQQQKPRKRDII